jgi:mRNA-degrading endonuclease toxin of MazEF toxin-antitoxin module
MTDCQVVYDVALGLALLAVDTLITVFVVNRVLARQDEAKRRRMSALAEAPIVERADGLLADGLPLDCRVLADSQLEVGQAVVPLQVESVDWDALAKHLHDRPRATVATVARGLGRTEHVLKHPLYAAVVDPSIAAELVRLVTAIAACSAAIDDVGDVSDGLPTEVSATIQELFAASWALRKDIVDRWKRA